MTKNFLTDQVTLAEFAIGQPVKNNMRCIHDIIAEWCAECKHLDTPSIKQVLLQENLAIVENLLSWPTKTRTT